MVGLFLLGMARVANAGGVLELVPSGSGPYYLGQSVGVEVWLHNEESFGVDLRLVALDVQGLRQRLFAGGDFQTSGGVTVNHIAKFSGGSWTAIDQGLEGPVYALHTCTLNGGTTLYVGGKVWGVSDWEATVNRLEAGWWTEIGRSPEGSVRSLFCWDNGASGNRLVAGGYIWTMDDAAAYGIAQWDGSDWTPLQNLDSGVRDMVVFDDGTGPALYAVGTFPSTMPPLRSSRCDVWENGRDQVGRLLAAESWTATANGRSTPWRSSTMERARLCTRRVIFETFTFPPRTA